MGFPKNNDDGLHGVDDAAESGDSRWAFCLAESGSFAFDPMQSDAAKSGLPLERRNARISEENRAFPGKNGEAGIRTRGTGVTSYNGLANRRFQPLSHLSRCEPV